MWVVAKIKKKELNIFKEKMMEALGPDIKFYNPKIEYQKNLKNKIKKFEKYILENYIFCYHYKFSEINTFNKVKFLRGLEYFLSGNFQNQSEIKDFIDYCKSFEDKDGYLKAAFFKSVIINKARFITGPFTNMVFEILKKEKNKLRILVGNVVTTISDKQNYLYRPV